MVTALDKNWHPECFCCVKCSRAFGEEGNGGSQFLSGVTIHCSQVMLTSSFLYYTFISIQLITIEITKKAFYNVGTQNPDLEMISYPFICCLHSVLVCFWNQACTSNSTLPQILGGKHWVFVFSWHRNDQIQCGSSPKTGKNTASSCSLDD